MKCQQFAFVKMSDINNKPKHLFFIYLIYWDVNNYYHILYTYYHPEKEFKANLNDEHFMIFLFYMGEKFLINNLFIQLTPERQKYHIKYMP